MDAATIRTCAALCSASYDDNDSRFVTVDELRFGMVNVDGQWYLVHRGTCNFDGWLDDFTITPARSPKGYLAHHGFADAEAKTFAAIDMIPKGCIITGHSLGGAITVLMAERTGCKAVTFGCPRVYTRLNETFPEMEHTRVVNRGDLVTQVPDALLWHHLCEPELIGPENLLDARYHDIGLYCANLPA